MSKVHIYLSNWSSASEVLVPSSIKTFVSSRDTTLIAARDIRILDDGYEFSLANTNQHLFWIERLAGIEYEDNNNMGFMIKDETSLGFEQWWQGDATSVSKLWSNPTEYRFEITSFNMRSYVSHDPIAVSLYEERYGSDTVGC
jgi:hypothetical protein